MINGSSIGFSGWNNQPVLYLHAQQQTCFLWSQLKQPRTKISVSSMQGFSRPIRFPPSPIFWENFMEKYRCTWNLKADGEIECGPINQCSCTRFGSWRCDHWKLEFHQKYESPFGHLIRRNPVVSKILRYTASVFSKSLWAMGKKCAPVPFVWELVDRKGHIIDVIKLSISEIV